MFCGSKVNINQPPKIPPENAPKNWKLEKTPRDAPFNSFFANIDNLAGREASKKLKPEKKNTRLAVIDSMELALKTNINWLSNNSITETNKNIFFPILLSLIIIGTENSKETISDET